MLPSSPPSSPSWFVGDVSQSLTLCDWVNNTNLLSTGEGDSSPNIKITSMARILNVASCHHRLKGLNEHGSGVFELFEIRVSTLRLEEGVRPRKW
ncbi:hypothetical protein F2Q68_00029239 [Brassica cretica]|uniref:Uncharacterized protein n=1 Tax=Brassica cretica TaxID=69181 RepID=A0A8S9GF60_BRACR|nr:hypothetical protein F2Q68_00029239 [Brassica cretica]